MLYPLSVYMRSVKLGCGAAHVSGYVDGEDQRQKAVRSISFKTAAIIRKRVITQT